MTITATRDGQRLPAPAVEETTTAQAAASVDYLTGNEPTKAEARELIMALTPALWNTPAGDNRESQVRRTLSALLHRDIAQSEVDDLLEAYDAIHHMEFGGCLEYLYGATNYDRAFWLSHEKEKLDGIVDGMTWGLRP